MEALWSNGPVRETVYQAYVSMFVDSTGIEVDGKLFVGIHKSYDNEVQLSLLTFQFVNALPH